jgi:hypothetical protein
MNYGDSSCPRLRQIRPVALALTLIALALPQRLTAEGEQRFASPEEAVKALTAAAENKDTNAMQAVFGPARASLISPDVVQANAGFETFVKRLKEKVELTRESDSRVTLQLGADGWPFPIPVVKQDGQWFFDTLAGKDEILNRRIGMDELGAIGVCRAYVDAQREYASEDRTGSGVLEYAQKLRSTPDTHDGLYWPVQPGDDVSPLGPLIAEARGQGYRRQHRILTEDQSPYRGYYFKILTRQGRQAPIGRYNYIINGHMIAGFALVAWPAQWDNTGIMTFIVNQQGKVYQKNLGPKTAAIAEKMKEYDPDSTWTLVAD